MKALSLWQPWASAIVAGYKKIETRHWKTYYRGPILIHAAKTDMGIKDYQSMLTKTLDNRGKYRGVGHFRYMNTVYDLPRGAIVAVAKLADVKTVLPDFTKRLSVQEKFWGNYDNLRYAWMLEDIEPLSPLPYRGRQGLFEIDPRSFPPEEFEKVEKYLPKSR